MIWKILLCPLCTPYNLALLWNLWSMKQMRILFFCPTHLFNLFFSLLHKLKLRRTPKSSLSKTREYITKNIERAAKYFIVFLSTSTTTAQCRSKSISNNFVFSEKFLTLTNSPIKLNWSKILNTFYSYSCSYLIIINIYSVIKFLIDMGKCYNRSYKVLLRKNFNCKSMIPIQNLF